MQRYPQYKKFNSIQTDSIPADWGVAPLKTVCDFRQGKAHEPFVTDDGKFLCVNSRFVSTQGKRKKYCSKNLTPARSNDILMVMSDLPNGRALARAFFVADGSSLYAVNQRVCAITAKEVCPKYLFYLLDRNPYFLMFDDGSNQTHLSNESFYKFPVLLPSTKEQDKIAQFLDHETARIDALIARQQKLIELLKEKRQAVISRAVTKGLNPDAKMKDSGVEWLGEIPEGWAIGCLGYFASISSGATPDRTNSNYWGGDIPWIKTGEVNYNEIHAAEESVTDFAISETALSVSEPGTMLMAMYGQGVTRGRVAVLAVSSSYNQACAAINFRSNYFVDYFKYFFIGFYEELRGGGNETSQMNLNTEIIGNIKIVVPPTSVQQDIANFLGSQEEKLNSLLSKAERQVRLLNEKKNSLISAAVTGKIDVRNWQPPAETTEQPV